MRGRLLVCLVVVVVSLGLAGPAHALGDQTGCKDYNYVSSTNDWHFFYAHKVRAYERACVKTGHTSSQDYPYLKWVRKPTITLPSVGPIPTGETVKIVSGPYLKRVAHTYQNRMSTVTWGFSARNQFSTFDFELRVNTRYDRLCVIHSGGSASCDVKDYW